MTMVKRRIFLVVGIFAVVLAGLATAAILHDRRAEGGPTTAPAPATAQVPSVAAPTAARPVKPAPGTPAKATASQEDSAAAARANWPYSRDVGGTPNLASALAQHMQRTAKAQQAANTAKPAASAAASTGSADGLATVASVAPTKAADPSATGNQSPVQRPYTQITPEFYHPKPPPRKTMPQGNGWPEAHRQPAKADG